MANVADFEVARPQKDTSSNFLSKITRSPSRKHKPQPSIPPAGPDAPFLAQTNRSHSGSISKRTQARPGFQRAPTAPAGPLTTTSFKSDTTAGESPIEGNMLSATSSAPTTLSKSADATPTAPEHIASGPAQMTTIPPPQTTPTGTQNPNSTYQHIQDLANKRIATLDYMRKAHEGRIHWFSTVHFSKADISKLQSYTPNRLTRRATNYFVLGLSIPAVLDVHPQPHPQSTAATNAAIAQEYLKSLNSLLIEFEAFQQLHPPDGSTASSLSRARIPQMFKRVPTVGKPRRTSGAAGTEIGLPMQQNTTPPQNETAHQHSSTPSVDTTNTASSFTSGAPTLVTPSSATSMPSISFPTSVSFPTISPYDTQANSTLLPNEGPYSHLLTPPLPFVPDFYCVFATLCDVLIDTYQRLLQLINAPAVCTASVGELFTKADVRLRKVMVGGIVREFEGAVRDGAKRELMGVQRVVLGGLIGAG